MKSITKSHSFWLISILFASFSVGCGLFDSGESEEPEFESEFQYQLNGEDYWSEPFAGIFPTSTDSALDVFGVRFDSSSVPYLHQLSYRVILEEGRTSYSVLRVFQTEPPMQLVGGSFSERDGDAPIAQYFPIESDIDRLEIHRGSSEFGPIVFGEFAMTVVVDDNISDFGRRNRRLPDTLRITNGRFQILLSQKDD